MLSKKVIIQLDRDAGVGIKGVQGCVLIIDECRQEFKVTESRTGSNCVISNCVDLVVPKWVHFMGR